ncbi:MAG: ribonuclease E/G [Opitutales bacterium]
MSSKPTSASNQDTSHDDLKAPPKEKPPVKINKRELRDDSRHRANKQRPVLQKIARAVTGKVEDEPYRELIINAEPLETRVALLVDGVLEKFEVERTGEANFVGAVFKGKIQNLEAGLKAAFVDIGQPKNAFLHYWDINPSAQEDNSIEVVRDTSNEEQKKKRGQKINYKQIPKLFPIGTDIVVQITKGQIGTKGPRTTTNLSLPGRFLVLMPYSGQCGISRKIENKEERERLKTILRSLTIPDGMGVIIRTAGEGKKLRYFIRDLAILLKKWRAIEAGMETAKKPAMLYQEPDITERTIRDFLTEKIDRVLIDNAERYEEMLKTVGEISKSARGKIHLYRDDIPIFERYNIERQIEQTYQRQVPLPSGGAIVIEETEALVAIDVNTGSHKVSGGKDSNFIVQANIEAAKEAARQIRLRNIGGLIILDFIDMKNPKDKKAVLNTMRREMAEDKAKHQILPISPLGIMQMTRQRHAESHASGIYDPCPYCTGKGVTKSPRTMSVEIQRRIVSIVRHLKATRPEQSDLHLRVLLHPENLERLRREDEQHLVDIERAYGVKLSFRADPQFHVENFKIIDVASGRELR